MRHKAVFFSLLLTVLFYIGSYVIFRQANIEVWKKDNREYVIFPENKVLYYFFRPAVLIDEKLTKMRFHIGQHR